MASVAQIQICKILNDILARRGEVRVDNLLAEARPILFVCGRSEGTAKSMLQALLRAGIVSRREDMYKTEVSNMQSVLPRLFYEIDHFVPRKDVLVQTSSNGQRYVIHMAFSGLAGYYVGDDDDVNESVSKAQSYNTMAEAVADIDRIVQTWNVSDLVGIGAYRVNS